MLIWLMMLLEKSKKKLSYRERQVWQQRLTPTLPLARSWRNDGGLQGHGDLKGSRSQREVHRGQTTLLSMAFSVLGQVRQPLCLYDYKLKMDFVEIISYECQ